MYCLLQGNGRHCLPAMRSSEHTASPALCVLSQWEHCYPWAKSPPLPALSPPVGWGPWKPPFTSALLTQTTSGFIFGNHFEGPEEPRQHCWRQSLCLESKGGFGNPGRPEGWGCCTGWGSLTHPPYNPPNIPPPTH